MTAPLLRIRQKFETELSTVALALGLPVVYENVVPMQEVGANDAWIECFLMPGQPQNPTMGDAHIRNTGIFQVSIHSQKDIGTADSTEYADAIQMAFMRGKSWPMADITAGGIVYDSVLYIFNSPGVDNLENGVLSTVKTVVTVYYQCDVYYKD